MSRYTVSKEFSFCYGHRLLNDTGKCRHLHGHTARVVLELCADKLDEQGMVLHFDRLKETMGKWIEQNLDHTLLLCEKDPLVLQLEAAGEKLRKIDCNPTAENIARIIFDEAKAKGLPVARVELWESQTAKACYEG